HDHALHHLRGFAAHPHLRAGGRGARRHRLGDLRRPRPGGGIHALSGAGALSRPGRLQQGPGRGIRPAGARNAGRRSHSRPRHTGRRVTIRRGIAILAVLALPAGCTVGPDYVAPDVAVPDSYGAEAPLPATAAAPTGGWWTGFMDPRLDHFVDMALSGNLD